MKAYTGAFLTTTAVPGGCLGALWTSTRRVRLLEARITVTSTAIPIRLHRTTAEGTVTASESPEALNGDDESSAVTLDRAFSVDPTFSGNALGECQLSGSVGQMDLVWEFYSSALWVPSGAGVGLKNNDGAATSGAHEVAMLWEE